MENYTEKNLIHYTGSKLSVLFVSAYWYYPGVMLEFVKKILDRGHKVVVCIGDSAKLDNEYLNVCNFYFPQTITFFSKINGAPYPIFRDVKNCFKRFRPDVVHINSHLFFCNYQIGRLAYSLGIPFIVTVHGFAVKRGSLFNFAQSIYLMMFARRLLKMATKVICLNKIEAEKVGRLTGECNKISIIPNGVDINFFKPLKKPISGTLVWIGRFVPEKGLLFLLFALQKVIRKNSAVKLLLGGDGPIKNQLVNSVKELGLQKNVVFLGSLGRTEVVVTLSNSSIFVLPSLKEGMPRALLEAMACGRPIIGTNISGIAAVVENGVTGFLVPPKDSEALSDAILKLLSDKDLRENMGHNARELIVSNYNSVKISEKVINVYTEAVNKKKE